MRILAGIAIYLLVSLVVTLVVLRLLRNARGDR